MLTEKQLKLLKSENELLLLQLEDVNEVIKQREQELEELRIIARHATQLQSRLDLNLVEFEQMQNNIGEKQQEAAGTNLRLEELEKELYNSIKMENKYNNLLDGHLSLQANLLDTNNELEETAGLYKKLKDVKTTLAQTQSSLEMATMEIQSLREELAGIQKFKTSFRGDKE